MCPTSVAPEHPDSYYNVSDRLVRETPNAWKPCLLYTSDAADERSSVDLGGRRIIKKNNNG